MTTGLASCEACSAFLCTSAMSLRCAGVCRGGVGSGGGSGGGGQEGGGNGWLHSGPGGGGGVPAPALGSASSTSTTHARATMRLSRLSDTGRSLKPLRACARLQLRLLVFCLTTGCWRVRRPSGDPSPARPGRARGGAPRASSDVGRRARRVAGSVASAWPRARRLLLGLALDQITAGR